MKVSFVVVLHQSKELRPQGYQLADRFATSLRNSMEKSGIEYQIVMLDNGSEDHYDFKKFNDIEVKYVYIPDQYEKGITGAWNLGISYSYTSQSDMIFVCNDDIEFNKTIVKLLKHIEDDEFKDDTVYGPLSNNGGGQQTAAIAKDAVYYLAGDSGNSVLNGFCFGFTSKFYEKYRHLPAEMFNPAGKWNGGDGKWGGQEGEFITWVEKGAKLKVFGPCWINHNKIRGWTKTRDKDKRSHKE